MQDVIVFGKGRYFQHKKENLKRKYHIVGFIDNAVKSEQAYKDEEENVIVCNPKEIYRFPDTSFVIIMSVKFFEMWKQLIELGVSENRIRFGMSLQPAYDEQEEYFINGGGVQIEARKGQLYFRSLSEGELFFCEEADYRRWLQEKIRENVWVKSIIDMPLTPVSRRFGLERGSAIDRYYIEKFISAHKDCICGDVMEIGDLRYTKEYAGNIKNSYVLHVNGWGDNVIKGNFETGEGIRENMADCLIFTQTLQHIYDIHSVVRNIYKMLKPGGKVLITSGVTAQLSRYDYHNWGEYWRLTDQSLQKLLCEVFAEDKVKVVSYGNVKTAVAFLFGLCAEDLSQTDFEFNDEQYPIVVMGVAEK